MAIIAGCTSNNYKLYEEVFSGKKISREDILPLFKADNSKCRYFILGNTNYLKIERFCYSNNSLPKHTIIEYADLDEDGFADFVCTRKNNNDLIDGLNTPKRFCTSFTENEKRSMDNIFDRYKTSIKKLLP